MLKFGKITCSLNFRYINVAHSSKNSFSSASESNKSPPKNLSFINGIFRGKVKPQEMFPFPMAKADEIEAVQMLVDPFDKFFQEQVNSEQLEKLAKLDEKVEAGLWEMGAFGIQVPQDLGGLGLNNVQCARMIQVVGTHDLGVAITLGAHQSIGFKGILLYGNEEQKKKYLPQVSSGKKYAAFALTEPTAGSDAASIKSRAVPSSDGKHYILNGSKIWITNGGFAEIFTVFAQTPVDKPKKGKPGDRVTAFIVERSFGGLTSGPPEKKMGIHVSNTTEVFFDNVKIPAENVLGGVGNGFKVAMNILNNGRFGMVAGLSGTIKTCTRRSVEFATQRKQFGKTIDNYGMIQEKIARMAMLQYVTESLAFMLSGNMDRGSVNYHLEAAICKCFASEAAWAACDEAIQVHGGMGYMQHVGLERILRNLRIFRIFEGSNEILRLLVALTGLRHAGVGLRDLQKAFKNPTANLNRIFGEVTQRAIKKTGLRKSQTLGQYVDSSFASPANLISECIDEFGETIESLLIRHGKSITDRQLILHRIADAAMYIYTSAVVLSRASKSLKDKLPTAEYEQKITEVWCNESYWKIKGCIKQIKKKQRNFKSIQEIARKVIENGGIVQSSPLNF